MKTPRFFRTSTENEKTIRDLVNNVDRFDNTIISYQSLQDDKDIDKRVTALESTVSVLKWITTLLFGSGIIWLILNYMPLR